MWDIGTIIQQNNEAALDWMMQGRKIDEAQDPHPTGWSLSLLADKMRAGPPNLKALVEAFTPSGGMEKFNDLIVKFLPEHLDEIMASPRHRRVYNFCREFSDRYFPLPGGAYEADVSQIVYHMPVGLMGLDYRSYHDLVFRNGYLLMLSLVIYPFKGDERDTQDDAVPFSPAQTDTKWKPSRDDVEWVKDLAKSLKDGGEWIAPMGFSITKINDHTLELMQAENTPEVKETIRRTVLIAEKAGVEVKVKGGHTAEEKKEAAARIPLLDMVGSIVGAAIVSRIPKRGWTPEDLHALTDGTKYEGLGNFADWACHVTGVQVLDHDYGDCQYIEGESDPSFKWSKYNVEVLTKQAPLVKQVRDKIDRISLWLEYDPISRFQELVDFLLDQPKPKVASRNYNREDWNWIELDQSSIDEDIDEDEDSE